MWFDSWTDLLRIALVGTAGYVTLVAVLRISGKRTLSQLNIFDFVVTVALGSILATVVLNADVAWAESAASFVLLAALPFIVAAKSTDRVRSAAGHPREWLWRRFCASRCEVLTNYGESPHPV